MNDAGQTANSAFVLEEATIADLHAAIRTGETTCVAVVQHYLARVRAYNGVASRLVTSDGAPVRAATGTVRAGAPVHFPTTTVKAADILPDLEHYQGPPLEFGRMQATASDPAVEQQLGMIAGIPGGTASSTRSRRSTSAASVRSPAAVISTATRTMGRCRPARRRSASSSASQPDALERAATLDATYGRNPDLDAMPMYGVVFSFKDPFDTRDMRSTGGGDAAYDIDFPARDHILVEQLRNKGAIIFAKAVCTEYNGRAGDPGGRHKPDAACCRPRSATSARRGAAIRPTCTIPMRAASLGSSSGSGVSVSANLVMASLGEETRASCRGPANHNAVALILPHKSMLGFDGGAIGADIYCDRSGILARTLADCAKILDALKDPVAGYYDPRDPYTTVPRASVLPTPYISHVTRSGEHDALSGVRLGVIVESMTPTPGSKAEGPIVEAARREIKNVLADRLGATLVESRDPLWTPDPDHEQMSTDFRRALAQLVPVFMPGILFRLAADGTPLFKDFAAAIRPTEFQPDRVFGSGTLAPIDYLVGLAEGRIAPPENLDIGTIQQQELAPTFRFHISQYLMRRAADWKALGLTETLADWASLNARSTFWGDDQRAAFRNWEEVADPRNPLGRPAGRGGAHHAARVAAPRRHDGDPREPARRAGTAAYAVAAGRHRRAGAAGDLAEPAAGVALRSERGTDRGAGAGRLRVRRL